MLYKSGVCIPHWLSKILRARFPGLEGGTRGWAEPKVVKYLLIVVMRMILALLRCVACESLGTGVFFFGKSSLKS